MPPRKTKMIDITGMCIQQMTAYRLTVMAELKHRVLKTRLKQLKHPKKNFAKVIQELEKEGQQKIRSVSKDLKNLQNLPPIITIHPQ